MEEMNLGFGMPEPKKTVISPMPIAIVAVVLATLALVLSAYVMSISGVKTLKKEVASLKSEIETLKSAKEEKKEEIKETTKVSSETQENNVFAAAKRSLLVVSQNYTLEPAKYIDNTQFSLEKFKKEFLAATELKNYESEGEWNVGVEGTEVSLKLIRPAGFEAKKDQKEERYLIKVTEKELIVTVVSIDSEGKENKKTLTKEELEKEAKTKTKDRTQEIDAAIDALKQNAGANQTADAPNTNQVNNIQTVPNNTTAQ